MGGGGGFMPGIATRPISSKAVLEVLRELAPPILLMALFVITGLRGRDFGHHWDEVEWQLQPVRLMVERGNWMPPAEIYPGMARWLVLLPALPAGLAGLVSGNGFRAALATALARPDYLIEARSLFIVVSSLAILWVYLAARAFERPVWESTAAAAGLALSWEYAYHARWLATDCIVVEFAALMLYMLGRFRRDGRRRFLYGAAVAAGLAMGTKYPAGMLLVPLWLSGGLTLPPRPVLAQVTRFLLLGTVASVAYLVTSPATLVDIPKFAERIYWIEVAYERANAGYAVHSAWQHLRVVLAYFGLTFFSPYRIVALLLFISAGCGVVAWWRKDYRTALALVSLPVSFLLVFTNQYRTVVMRNYLFLSPFFALFMARGLGWVAAQAHGRRPILGLGALLLAAIGIAHAGWLVVGGESIRRASPESEVKDAFAYVASHASTTFRLSPGVVALGQKLGLTLPPNAQDPSAGKPSANVDAFVLFARAEGPSPFTIPSNDPFLTLAVFGPREVNFNWYASWTGADRVIVMSRAKARRAGVALAQ